MRPPRTELSLTEWVVLALVSEGPTHGWAIVRALRPEGSIGVVWSTTGPLVYRAISLLEQAGLIRSTGIAEGRGPGRVMLEALPAGTEQVGEWLMRPVDHIREIRTELLVKLLLLGRRGLDRRVLVARQIERLRPVAESLRARVGGSLEGDRVVDAWRAINADATMQFLGEVERDAIGSADAAAPNARSAEWH